jgi:hypothetical protein
VISWFRAFAFKWVNLYRYGEELSLDRAERARDKLAEQFQQKEKLLARVALGLESITAKLALEGRAGGGGGGGGGGLEARGPSRQVSFAAPKDGGGLYTFTIQFTHSSKAPGFQPLHLRCDSLG